MARDPNKDTNDATVDHQNQSNENYGASVSLEGQQNSDLDGAKASPESQAESNAKHDIQSFNATGEEANLLRDADKEEAKQDAQHNQQQNQSLGDKVKNELKNVLGGANEGLEGVDREYQQDKDKDKQDLHDFVMTDDSDNDKDEENAGKTANRLKSLKALLSKIAAAIKAAIPLIVINKIIHAAKSFIHKAIGVIKEACAKIGHAMSKIGHWLYNHSPRLIKAAVNKVGHFFGKTLPKALNGLADKTQALVTNITHSAAAGAKAAVITKALTVATLPVTAVGVGGFMIGEHIAQSAEKNTAKLDQVLCDFGAAVASVLKGDSSTEATKASSGGAVLNDNQHQIFNLLTQKFGFSGAAAAGVVGNTAVESHGDPCIVEGGGDKDTPDGVGGGYGIFQFTPPTGYANWMHQHGKSKATIEDELTYAFTPGVDKSIISTLKAKGVWDKLTHASDPTEASNIWLSDYEIPADIPGNEPIRAGYAKQAYDAWNGSSISANDGLLGKLGGGSDGGASATADGNDATAANASTMSQCGHSKTNDGNGNVADGTGSIKESAPSGLLKWAKDDVPDDVKQFIHDPSKAGLSWGSSNGWSSPSGQCVGFSVSYFYALWKGAGAPKNVPGNGGDIAGNEAKAMGGKTSDQPHAGAVVSIPGGTVESPGPWGHTFIVEHVLKNGDIIVAEQNMIGFGMHGGSGDDVGKPETWNYGLVTKKWYQDNHAQFFTPSKGSPNWGS